ncbi:DNA/RNA non-specific endonuclease (plasmid) [Rhizobium leguminosarum]
MTPLESLARLRHFNESVRNFDAELAEETLETTRQEISQASPNLGSTDYELEQESIVMRSQRPVLAVFKNDTVLKFEDQADSLVWTTRLEKAKSFLQDASRAVGRINLAGSPYEWVGTGWLVHDNILVTNRHVANEFAVRGINGLYFSVGESGPIKASADFLQEIDNSDQLVFKLVRPLFIQDAPGPDVAFFEIDIKSGEQSLAKSIDLVEQPRTSSNVAVIGYPAYDSRIPDIALMEKIYGKTYNKKRVAPGSVTRVDTINLLHDCSTLGGNSGSAVLDLNAGKAVGLHFSGRFLSTNFAVRSDIVAKLLADIRNGTVRPEARKPVPAPPKAKPAPAYAGGTLSTNITIPLNITISVGEIGAATVSASAAIQDVADNVEKAADDLSDRRGYQADFLGPHTVVPLPTVGDHKPDILTYDNAGISDTVLRYEHFSVLMSKSRRMCLFSAVNIDGKVSKKGGRVGWKYDPRILKSQQIMDECYGAPPKFSRGHMTRREDPGWGDGFAAKRGNEDSMHVTNATPQMQAFNAPIWLALEDYALEHAREDEMKISVFTGPYFADDDPEREGVRIPVAFWKIIAFIHDETGALCATGYEMDQRKNIPSEDEFVFGGFTSPQLGTAIQVPIASIQARSGLDFANLAQIDPLSTREKATPVGQQGFLLALEQIRFL